MVVLTFDADKDKRFSAAEAKSVEQKHFANLKDFNFFVQLRVNDKPVTVTTFKDFQVTLANGQAVYTFTVPVKAAEGTLDVAVEALVDASQEDAATGGPDPTRGIFPTVVVVTSEGAESVGEDELRGAYERVVGGGS